jgi:hypothetical protein
MKKLDEYLEEYVSYKGFLDELAIYAGHIAENVSIDKASELSTIGLPKSGKSPKKSKATSIGRSVANSITAAA